MQEGVRESQPQAVPYAAAVIDPDLAENAKPIDQGVEHGLATSAATDQADVAYSIQGQTAELAANSAQLSNAGETSDASAIGTDPSGTETPAGNVQLPAEVLRRVIRIGWTWV